MESNVLKMATTANQSEHTQKWYSHSEPLRDWAKTLCLLQALTSARYSYYYILISSWPGFKQHLNKTKSVGSFILTQPVQRSTTWPPVCSMQSDLLWCLMFPCMMDKHCEKNWHLWISSMFRGQRIGFKCHFVIKHEVCAFYNHLKLGCVKTHYSSEMTRYGTS